MKHQPMGLTLQQLFDLIKAARNHAPDNSLGKDVLTNTLNELGKHPQLRAAAAAKLRQAHLNTRNERLRWETQESAYLKDMVELGKGAEAKPVVPPRRIPRSIVAETRKHLKEQMKREEE